MSLFGLGPLCLLDGCSSMPPTSAWVTALDKGLKEPAGTFATFRAAFCADALELEFRCLAPEFREQLGGGDHLSYREARDQLLKQEPYLRYVLAKAEVERIEPLGPREVRLVASAMGRTIHVRLVREDFWEIRAKGEPLDGDYVPDASRFLETAETSQGAPVLRATVPLESAEDGAQADELEISYEWKIAGFEDADKNSP
jgi:hypothetical protein